MRKDLALAEFCCDSTKKMQALFIFAAPKFGSFKNSSYLCSVKGETEQSHDVRNGGICVMMSNSTLPLGFFH